MIPLHSLLRRIRWDRDFGSDEREIDYWDRVLQRIVRILFTKIVFASEERASFLFMGRDGVYRRIPLHRVRQVYKNSVLIWARE